MNRQNVTKWCREFSEGRTDARDEQRSIWRNAPRIWRDFGSELPFQTRLTQTELFLPLLNEHGSQVKDQGWRQCWHNEHKKFPYRPTRDVPLLSGRASYTDRWYEKWSICNAGRTEHLQSKPSTCHRCFIAYEACLLQQWLIYPSILSALQHWVSLGLHNNQYPLLPISLHSPSTALSSLLSSLLQHHPSILTHCGPVMQICVFTLQLCGTGDANLRF